MGQHWLKNRPKTPRVPQNTVKQTALNLDDLPIASSTPDGASGAENASDVSNTPDASGTEPTGTSEQVASETSSQASEAKHLVASQPLDTHTDRIMEAWMKVSRTPFEASPFLKMIEDSQKAKAASEAEALTVATQTVTVKRKPTQAISAAFSGTIETEKGLFAIIDKRTYQEGQDFGGRIIKKIEKSLITLENPSGIYLLPKTGASVSVASDGTVTFRDEFAEKNPLGN
ncbi:MAG: hypothetical protein WA705_13380 [Candidatus Ozemobacteraceae bacterium]